MCAHAHAGSEGAAEKYLVAAILVQLRTWVRAHETAGYVYEAMHDVLVGQEIGDGTGLPYQTALVAAGYARVGDDDRLVYDSLFVCVVQRLQAEGDVYHQLRRRLFAGKLPAELFVLAW
ncbi:MAG: hypothetical protein RLZZ297_2100 [Chloroflexota bacterium]|jgi:uncharacterized protein YcfJ